MFVPAEAKVGMCSSDVIGSIGEIPCGSDVKPYRAATTGSGLTIL